MRRSRPFQALIAIASFVAATTSAIAAAQAEIADLPFRHERMHVTYTLNPDGSSVEVRERAIRVLKTQALEYLKQASVSYSTSVQRAEVLEAYTLKADGRRIDVPRSNYQFDINKGNSDGAPAFSDWTRMTVIFPDTAVGDLLVLKHRITDVEPMFPGHFSVNERFARAGAYDEVKVRFEIPESLWTQHSVTGMAQELDEKRDGRRVIAWTWKNPSPVKSQRRNFTSYDPDKEPGYSLSTFRQYSEIAEAYGKRARPKAAVTERVRQLAAEITKGANGQRDQVKALYEWVATNIHFAGNCVGVGAVVPREQGFVLDNKMGDCKDHATLLQALLAARGIGSTQALVNSGSTYHLPKVPVLSMVNHVILYVPSLELYLDSTSATTPFGMLPMGDADKPVLHVDGYRDGRRTPALASAANRQQSRTEVTIKADGGVAGSVQVATHGLFAVSGRDRWRNVTAQQREDWLKEMYRRDRPTGFGRLESDDPKPLDASFKYKVTFETEEFTQMPGPGAFTITPLFLTEAPIHGFTSMTEEERVAEESACMGGSIVEEYVYRLPKGMKVLAVPKNVSLASGPATYKATYSLKGATLTVRRELVDRTDRNICPIAMQREFAALARKIAVDLKAQVVYQ